MEYTDLTADYALIYVALYKSHVIEEWYYVSGGKANGVLPLVMLSTVPDW